MIYSEHTSILANFVTCTRTHTYTQTRVFRELIDNINANSSIIKIFYNKSATFSGEILPATTGNIIANHISPGKFISSRQTERIELFAPRKIYREIVQTSRKVVLCHARRISRGCDINVNHVNKC